jgi:hypothetical protein
MYLSRRRLVALLTATALAASAASAVTALADRGESRGHGPNGNHGALLDAGLAPSVPTDPVLNGVAPGGLPWVLKHGEARVSGDGDLRVRLDGLVIPAPAGDGTPGPVMTLTASLYCGGSTTPVGTTPAAPIARDGDARLEGSVALPAKCLAPLVLVHPNGGAGAYIAASGLGG